MKVECRAHEIAVGNKYDIMAERKAALLRPWQWMKVRGLSNRLNEAKREVDIARQSLPF